MARQAIQSSDYSFNVAQTPLYTVRDDKMGPNELGVTRCDNVTRISFFLFNRGIYIYIEQLKGFQVTLVTRGSSAAANAAGAVS